jgi:hypothetical protein
MYAGVKIKKLRCEIEKVFGQNSLYPTVEMLNHSRISNKLKKKRALKYDCGCGGVTEF